MENEDWFLKYTSRSKKMQIKFNSEIVAEDFQ